MTAARPRSRKPVGSQTKGVGAPSYPDSWSVAGFFFNCVSTDQEVQCRQWLQARELSSTALVDEGLAFALGLSAQPAWAQCAGLGWYESGLRLVLPLWAPCPDQDGRLEAVSVLACRTGDNAGVPQVVTPAGFARRGLVMATGWNFLADGRARRLVTVCTGPDDFLALSQWPSGARGALIGGLAGGSPVDVFELIPEGWTVALAMPATLQGDDDARRWRNHLYQRGFAVARCPLSTSGP